MIRLYVIVEGLTELNFVSQLLRPHLQELCLDRIAIMRPPRLDGRYTYAQLKKLAKSLIGVASEVVVTTMVDLFKLPSDWPGVPEAADISRPLDRVCFLEQRCCEDFGDTRFLPHLSLHEFEALVLCDLEALAAIHPNRSRELGELGARLKREFESPEHVNRQQPPSYRIRAVLPEYQKATDGIQAVTKLGLAKLCERCTHFKQWLHRLEGIASVDN